MLNPEKDVVIPRERTVESVSSQEAACYQRILDLESKIPIFLVTEPFSPDLIYREFDHTNFDGRRVLAACDTLPCRMLVPAKEAKFLSGDMRAKLGPFRMLILAEHYVNKPYLDLIYQRGVESAVVAKVRREYEAGSLTLGAHHEQFVQRWTIAGLLKPKPADEFEYNIGMVFLRNECARARVIIEKYIVDQKKLYERTLPLPSAVRSAGKAGAAAGAAAGAVTGAVTTSSASAGAKVDVATAVRSSAAAPPIAAVPAANLQSRSQMISATVDPTGTLPFPLRDPRSLTNGIVTTQPFRAALQSYYCGKAHEETMRLLSEQDCAAGNLVKMLTDRLFAHFTPDDRLLLAGAGRNPSNRPHMLLREAHEQVMREVVASLPRITNGLFDGRVVEVLPESVLHRPDVDASAELVADLLRRLPTLTLQVGATGQMRLFRPESDVGREIMQGLREMPPTMVVGDKSHFSKLPAALADRILPFSSLASADLYNGKSYRDLNGMLELEQNAIESVSCLYFTRRLRFSHPDHQYLLHLCANAGFIDAKGDVLYAPGPHRGWIATAASTALQEAGKLLKRLKAGVSPKITPAACNRLVNVPKASSSALAGAAVSPVSVANEQHLLALESKIPCLFAQKGALKDIVNVPNADVVQKFVSACSAFFQDRGYEEKIKALAEQDFALVEILQLHADNKLPRTLADNGGLINRLVVAGFLPRAGALTDFQIGLITACDQARKGLIRGFPRTSTHDNGTYGQLILIPPNCVLHRPGVDCSPDQVADLLRRIPTLRLQEGLTLELRIFKPTKPAGQEILRQERLIPPTMVVDHDNMKVLPSAVRGQLGPFRCAVAADLFCGRSHDELHDLLLQEQEALKEVNRLYAVRRLRFSHPDHQHLLQLCANARYIEPHGETLYIPATSHNWIADHATSTTKTAKTLLGSFKKAKARAANAVATMAHSNAQDLVVFNPRSGFGMDISAGRAELPHQMHVASNLKAFLPLETRKLLGPFSSLVVAQKYVGKSYAELVQEQEAAKQQYAHLQYLYSIRDNDNPAFGSTPAKCRARITKLVSEGILKPRYRPSENVEMARRESLREKHELRQHIAQLKAQGHSQGQPSSVVPLTSLTVVIDVDCAGGAGGAEGSGVAGGPAAARVAKTARAEANPHKRKSSSGQPALDVIDLTDDTEEPAPAEKRFRYFVPSKPAHAQINPVPAPRAPQASPSNTRGVSECSTMYVPIAPPTTPAPTVSVPVDAVAAATAPVVSETEQLSVVYNEAPIVPTMAAYESPPDTLVVNAATFAVSMTARRALVSHPGAISFSKPLMRRSLGGRGASLGSSSLPDEGTIGGAAVSVVTVPAPAPVPVHAVLQQSREIQESINAMKQQLDESRKRHSLG